MTEKLKNIFSQSECLTEDLLFKYIDNKVSSDERHMVEKHLLDCELCSDALEGLKLINTKKAKNIIGELKSGIYSRTKKSKTKIIEFNYKWAYAIAAMLTFLFGISFLFNYILKKEIVAPVVVKNDKIKTEQNEFIGTYTENKTSVLPEKKKEKTFYAPPDKNEGYGYNTGYGGGSQGNTKTGKEEVTVKEYVTPPVITSGDSINNISPKEENKKVAIYKENIVQKNEPVAKEEDALATKEKSLRRKGKKIAPSYSEKTSQPVTSPSAGDEGNFPVSNVEVKDYNTDLKKYEKILKENPDDYNAIYNSGIAYYNLKKYKEAIEKFDKTIAVSSGEYYEDALWYKALSLINSGKKEDAKIIIDKIILLDKKYKNQAEKKKTELE
ncbi:MAG: zf-HC2 domain-containing protein [Bacteroidales bacterium]|nr:zf-HC2 domain-containing protein [Bacteroidales bacterium]